MPCQNNIDSQIFHIESERNVVRVLYMRLPPIPPHMLHGLGTLRGVARPVAQEQAVEGILGEVVVPGHHGDAQPHLVHKVPDDVVLDATLAVGPLRSHIYIYIFILTRE